MFIYYLELNIFYDLYPSTKIWLLKFTDNV